MGGTLLLLFQLNLSGGSGIILNNASDTGTGSDTGGLAVLHFATVVLSEPEPAARVIPDP